MISRSLKLLAFVAVFFVSSSFAKTLTNTEMLTSLTDSLINESLVSFFTDSDEPVILKSIGGKEEFIWFFENRILKYLENRHYSTVFQNVDSLNDSVGGLIVEYSLIDLGIDYQAGVRNSAQQNNQLQRSAEIVVDIRILQNNSGRILLSERLSKRFNDAINIDQIDDIEDDTYSFSKVRNEYGKSSRLLKAVVVTAVTGLVVYLFYSLRSR